MDYGDGLYPVDEVHKIGILDIRILNCDRNEGNILIEKVEKNKNNETVISKLIPIYHGLSMPSDFEIMDYEIAWMAYGASEKPFSKANLEFIEKINIDDDLNLLR